SDPLGEKTDQAPKDYPGKRIKATSKVAKSGKKKPHAQGFETLSEIALTEAEQMKVITKRSKTDYHVSHASSSGTHEGTGVTPGVPDVPTYGSKEEQISWKSSNDENDDETESDNDGDDFVHINLSTFDEKGRHEEKLDEEKRHKEKPDEEEEGSDQRFHTPSHFVSTNDEAYDEGRDTEKNALLANVQATQVIDDTHVIMTVVTHAVKQQSSSVSPGFISKTLNLNPDTCIDSILNLSIESTSLVNVPVTTNDKIPPSSVTTLPPPPISLIHIVQQTPVSTPTIAPTNLSKLELKKILIDKMESNKLVYRSVQQKTLYEALIDAYETDKKEDPCESFNELIDPSLDFSAFMLNRLKVDTLTPELLAGLTFELMKGSCKSLVELEYFLKEVCKATTDQLALNNPEGHQYPHDLHKPLPLIPNLRVNRESARDVYSRSKIIAIKKLMIVEWHNYKHLEWITVRRDNDKLYTFKEGDYNKLRLQDIKYMLLLLVQGKLTNLNIEESLALDVSLQMFTRSIVIQKRVEDLQVGIKSYQNKLNLTKLDTYRSDLKCKTSYTTYFNLRGLIYQNKDKKNRLIRIDELHRFSDGTLNDIRSALNDILKRIRIEYLQQTV
nr:hypothetical protein [Tanacetum cinerariifolium]